MTYLGDDLELDFDLDDHLFYQDEQKAQQRARRGMSIYDDFFEEAGGRRDDGATFDDCECLRSTERAILVRFKDGAERWIPKSQLLDSTEVRAQGDRGALSVTDWFAERFDEEQEGAKKAPKESTLVKDVRVMRETEKAICIQVGDDDDAPGIWIPKSHVLPDSEVRGDGDVGTIKISRWIADQKGLASKQAPSQSSMPQDRWSVAACRCPRSGARNPNCPVGRELGNHPVGITLDEARRMYSSPDPDPFNGDLADIDDDIPF